MLHNACKIGKIYLQNFSLSETILFFSSQNVHVVLIYKLI